ncbi:MAG: methyl-accepting chemotaxis protein [Rhodospirillaceae bacterium]
MSLANLGIKAMLLIGFGAVLALMAGLGLFSLTTITGLTALTSRLYQHPFLVSTAALQAESDIIAMHRSMKDVVLSTDAAGLDRAVAAVAAGEADVLAHLAMVEQRFLGDKTMVNEATEAFRAWKPIREAVIARLREGKRAEAIAITREQGAGQVARITKEIGDLVAFSLDKAAKFDAMATAERDRAIVTLYGLMAVIALAGLGIALVITLGINRPLGALRRCMARLAEGDFAVAVPYLDNTSEVGEMAQSVAVFKTNGERIQHFQVREETSRLQAEREKRAALNKLADDFEAHINSVVDHVASASTEMNATAQSMSAVSDQAMRQASAVSSAATQASGNVQTVASAAEQLATSIIEIGRQVSESTRTTRTAVDKARQTNQIVASLSDAAQKIGEVVNLINSIAGQTNLLALNATIEAARAGEAGKGFAVVASEVKNLANQTAKATGDISAQIGAVQTATGQAVQAIQEIMTIIDEVSTTSTAIAAAVGQQQAATGEIARNVEQAAIGTDEVARNISGVTQAASEAGRAAEQVLSEARDLSKQSESLRTEVDGFMRRVRSA